MLEFHGNPQFLDHYRVTSFRVEQGIGGAGHCALGLSPADSRHSSMLSRLNALQPDIGKTLTVTCDGWDFFGTISSVGYNDVESSFEVVIRDPLAQLVNCWGSRVHASRSIRDIVSATTLSKGSYRFLGAVGDAKVSLAIQYQESVAEFLLDLLSARGATMWCDGGDVVIGDTPPAKNWDLRLGFDIIPIRIESSIGSESIETSMIDYEDHNRVLKCTVSGSASDAGELQSAAIDARQSAKNLLNMHITGAHPRREDAMAFASGQLKSSVAARTRMSAQITRPYPVGSRLTICHESLDGATSGKNAVVLTHLNGDWTAGMVTPRWECLAVDIDGFGGSARVRHTPSRISTAIVESSSEAENRVKVSFPWDPDRVVTPWLRMTASAWGADHRTYVPPRVGDTVLVAWGQGDLDPIVLGALAAGDRVGDPKQRLVYESGAGHRISVDEKLILVTNKAGNAGSTAFEIGPDHVSASVNDKISFLMNGDTIELKHQSGGNISISSGGIVLNSTGQIEIKSGGGGTIQVSGPKVAINGGALEVI